MSYNNWNIPSDLFSIKPVNKNTIENFIGRRPLISKISKLISLKNIRVIFEGEVGTGKTSLGNYIRFTQEKSFSTDIEIMCQAHWRSREFLLALQSSVVGTCRKDFKLQDVFKKADIFQRIFERNSNIRISNYQGGISILGTGANAGEADGISQPINLDDQTLINELEEILTEIKKHKSIEKKCDIDDVRIIFQINNLDPSELPFTEDHIISFLNGIRDIITDKVDATFIINGATGLSALVEKRVKRLAPCVISEKVRALSKDELIEALNLRIHHSEDTGEIPFGPDLIDEIYNSTNGNFRKTLGLMEELAIYYDNEEPLINGINLQDCYNYFSISYSEDVKKFALRAGEITNKGKIIKALTVKPMLNVSEVAEEIGIQQGNASTLISELETDGALFKVKDSSSVRCLLSPKYYFAAKIVFQDQ